MLNLPNTIPIKEIAQLMGVDMLWVRQRVEDKEIVGFVGGTREHRSFRIPRIAFYKSMGWETDEEIRHAYAMAGIELKEKVDAVTSTQNN